MRICLQRRKGRGEGGLALLELLVAMAILSIGIVGVLRAFSSGTITCKAAEEYSVAALLAHQAASELERMDDLDTGHYSGSFAGDTSGYSWEADVQQAAGNDLRQVKIVVHWEVGKRRKHLDLETCLLPRRMQQAEPSRAQGDET